MSPTGGHTGRAIVGAGLALLRRGLVEASAGNLSARLADGDILITPSGLPYDEMGPADLVRLRADGTVAGGGHRPPSTESALHLACYAANPSTASVVHSHPLWATMFAVAHQPIPCCIDELADSVGGGVRCAAYAPAGGGELAEAAVAALEGRTAALLANHGLVAVGASVADALHVTILVERAAQIVWGSRFLGGPQPLA